MRIFYFKRGASVIQSLALVLCVTALSTPTQAASNLMELLSRNKQQQAQTPQVQSSNRAQSNNGANNSAAQNATTGKRVVVAKPRNFTYRVDPLVELDFSTVDFEKTGALTSDLSEDALTTPEHDPSLLTQAQLQNLSLQVEKDIAAALVAYYGQDPHPIWVENQQITPRATALISFLQNADQDGLNPEDYTVSINRDETKTETGEQAAVSDKDMWLQFDITLSARALRYAMDAQNGRIIANRLSAYHDLPRHDIDLVQVLADLASADQPQQVLADMQPNSIFYHALKQQLAVLSQQQDDDFEPIQLSKALRAGQSHPQFPLILMSMLKAGDQAFFKDYGFLLYTHRYNHHYDPALVPAIKAFQTAKNLSADGVIGPATIAALQDETIAVKRQRIIAALERLRWLPHDFGEDYVFINQPSFTAQYFEQRQQKLDMRVVIGAPHHQTNFFYDKISLVTFNPSWGVPRSIVYNEMMPRILRDPSYLGRNGYEVYLNGKQVSASAVDWNKVATTGRGVGIRQKPGRNNSLGELKILFPNKHNIYLHDTPSKAYFQRDMRALSHGCIRLADPRAMAAAVLGWQVDDLKPYFGNRERSVKLERQIPVYLTYFTAWPDSQTGEIRYYNDVYQRDTRLIEAMDMTSRQRNL